jgi:type IV secretory pathway VirB10-like protein
MYSALAILGGALVTCVLGALLFGSGEDARTREVRRLMTALEAQRRVRDARARRAGLRRDLRPARDEQPTVEAAPEKREEHAAEPPADRTARESEERQRRREEKERAAAVEAERRREKQADAARRKAEQAARKAEEQQRRDEEKQRAAAVEAERRRDEAEREAAEAAGRGDEERRRREQLPRTPVESTSAPAQEDLTERPLYAWAQRIESENRPNTGTEPPPLPSET